jgi:ketosteroid isomerase-like protein
MACMHPNHRRFAFPCLCAVLFAGLGLPLRAQPAAAAPAAAIRCLLEQQQADWNRGDVAAFATGYKHAPDILFVGPTIARGYDGMLAHYRERYPTRGAMGTLTFSGLEVQPLDQQFATATGHFHLDRTSAAGGNADGYFLLVLEQTPAGWKIVRDDTTPLSTTPK